jgi:NAD(P)H-flavin reductase
MMKFVTIKLLEAGFAGENIYLSMEKNMSCGIGQCRHCRMGKFLTCKDGPVLTWEQIKDIEDPFL